MYVSGWFIGLINAGIIFFTFITVRKELKNVLSNMWNIYTLSDVECRMLELEIMRLMELWHVKWEKEQKKVSKNKDIDQILKKIKKRVDKESES